MIGIRLKRANLIAKKRYNRKIWSVPELGSLRKNNTVCSCEMCGNSRRCSYTPKNERPTVQERKAATIESFEEDTIAEEKD